MKNLTTKTLIFPSLMTTILLFQGCSSHKLIHESQAHLYNNNFGEFKPYHENIQEEQKTLTQKETIYASNRSSLSDDSTLTTELIKDPDAFTLEEYVPTEPVITYKYMQSPKFYTEDELPENKLLTTPEID